MAGDGEPPAVHLVQEHCLDGTCLAIGEHNGLADQFRLSPVKFPQDCRSVLFGLGHCFQCLAAWSVSTNVNLTDCSSCFGSGEKEPRSWLSQPSRFASLSL